MLRKTVLSFKSPTGAFTAALRSANANLFNKVQEKLAKNKKAVRKQWLEDLVVNETMRNMQLLKRYRNAAISSACIWRSHLRP